MRRNPTIARVEAAASGPAGKEVFPATRPAWIVAAGALALCTACAVNVPRARYEPPYLVDAEFYIKALGDRCVDFGGEAYWKAGEPVYIYSCNETAAQKVRVKEMADGSHDFELRVRDVFCLGVSGSHGRALPGRPLELQSCVASPAQRFAFDGDAILMGGQASGRVTREFVIEPARGFTTVRTPLVVGTQDVSDAEYFRFRAVDGSSRRPHSGFVLVSSETALDRELLSGRWGKVIELDDTEPIRLFGPAAKTIPAGVTLRGYRKRTYQGPELFRCTNSLEPLFKIKEENVRLTGFRLRGPVDDPVRCRNYVPPLYEDGKEAYVNAIEVRPHVIHPVLERGHSVLASAHRLTDAAPIDEAVVPRVLIDHLDLGYWAGSGIDVEGPGPVRNADPPDPRDDLAECSEPPHVTYPRETRVRAVGNFFHHVDPYGMVVGAGAFTLFDGNVAYLVRNHAIADEGSRTSGYLAYHNLMLSHSGGAEIDVHGSLDIHHWHGGIAGHYFDVGWNTMLGLKKNYNDESKVNVDLRGTPCLRFDLHHNVFRRSAAESIKYETVDPANKFRRWANIFGVWAPLDDLAVGDFDGDGIDDIFTGTGAAWYYSSGGSAEWRFLNRMPEKASALRFGDFDADGRTDVLALHDGEIDISWAGGSPWQTVNVTAWSLADLAVGNFDGDRYDDLFLATGSEWFVAPAARNWGLYSRQAGRTANLRFGDLSGDGKTDVVAAGTKWRMLTRHSGQEQWMNLHSSLTGPLIGVVAADFTGDGRADLAWKNGYWGWLSDAGMTSATQLRPFNVHLDRFPIGHFFDGDPVADVAMWSPTTELHFDYAPGARNPTRRLSRQPMR